MTQNQIANYSFEDNFVANALDMPDKSGAIYDLTGGYNVIDYLVTRNAPATRTYGLEGLFQKPIIGSFQIVQPVDHSLVLGNGNLRVFFVDTTFPPDKGFRVQEVIGDGTSSNIQGLIVNVQVGYVDVENINPSIAAWDATLHFTNGTVATYLFPAAPNRGSQSMVSRFEYPKYVNNQTSILHDSLMMYRRDFSQSWIKDMGDGIWGLQQEPMFVKRLAKALEFRALLGKKTTLANSSIGGATNFSMGMKDAVRDPERGGIYQSWTSRPNQAQLEAWLGRIADRQNTAKTTISIGLGRGALGFFQSITSDYVKYSGKNNTFGGSEVKGIDVYQYNVNGYAVELAMLPFLNDPQQWIKVSGVSGCQAGSQMSYTMIAFDFGTYDAITGESLPSIEKVYFGDQEFIYGYVPGLIGNGSRVASDIFKTGKMFGSNSKDAVSLEYYTDCCYDFMAYRSGWSELAY